MDVSPEGGHFVHDASAIEDPDGAEVDAHRYRPLSTEDLLDLLGPGIGGEIPVQVRMAEQRVAHGAAHAPRLEAVPLEVAGELDDALRRLRRAQAVRLTRSCHSAFQTSAHEMIFPCAAMASACAPNLIWRPRPAYGLSRYHLTRNCRIQGGTGVVFRR